MYMQSLARAQRLAAREPRECGTCGNDNINDLIKFHSMGKAVVTCKYGKGHKANA
jgi:hypothetical protein